MSSGGVKGSEPASPLVDSLNNLAKAEQDVVNLLKLAKSTAGVLSEVPDCDGDKLMELAMDFGTTVEKIRATLLNESHLVRPYVDSGGKGKGIGKE
jgi:hypothetical protein